MTDVRRKIILDCDPGHDDAVAILLAAGHPSLEMLGITTVAGNADADKTARNALQVCEVAGLPETLPVCAGASGPLVRPRLPASKVHGSSGMDGPVLAQPRRALAPEHAVDFIIRMLRESAGDVTLVPVGPLTNIALALRKAPDIAARIEEIVVMGGAYFGNKTPAAEFNLYNDPEAARIVFESGAKLTMVGLELTHQAVATPAFLAEVAALEGAVPRFVSELYAFVTQTYKAVYGMDGAPVHDACCVAYCIDPELFTTRHLNVVIETRGEYTAGMTVIDRGGVTGRPPNVDVAERLRQERFWPLLLETFARYGQDGTA
ncbi:nucleoside hydrolase [Paenibacillus sp. IB182496]|uniref:Nucleoside hydrolase n=1 Tax=Paenibacillus sabuli TaxID=2772509 RepID=A0A927BU43_9BACL|nr:nucleoside hydrolase [Paenibacillus sabuli]MBD2846851.1 nucleoside hydrolase [Paenibacillus sabuli]